MNLKKICEEFLGYPLDKEVIIEFSGRMSRFNARVYENSYQILFKLSKDFLETEEDIQRGVVEYLLQRLHKTKKNSFFIEHYLNFIKKISDYSTEKEVNEELKKSFERVNKKYFGGFMEMPSLKWSGNSVYKLGSYTYAEDTIRISNVLKGNEEFLDYVMYHELLHKKHKFYHKNGKTKSHTKKFRKDEAAFGENIEERLKEFLKSKTRKENNRRFSGFLAKVFGYHK